MLKELTKLFDRKPRPVSERQISTDPVSVMVQTLNHLPAGTRVPFDIDFGPGIRTARVTAYIDADLLRQTGGQASALRIEGLPEELRRFLSS